MSNPIQHTNLIQHTTEFAMHIVSAYVQPGDVVIDATCGNGHDTLQLLRIGGLLCITMYSGHPAGAEEKRALLAWAEGLDAKQWHVSYVSMLNQHADPPEILLISRKR